MKFAIISTWCNSYEGTIVGYEVLKKGGSLNDALVLATAATEDNPKNQSVGYGGLPNKLGQIELDAAFMDGTTLNFGGIIAAKNIKNPIKVAYKLSENHTNLLLSGEGAEKYAKENGFEFADMFTKEAEQKWQKELHKDEIEYLSYRDNHDTVCTIGWMDGKVSVAVSTSGLFMKEQGRVGDSPIIGSGFYANKFGAAASTGLGEDVMKGCLSYEIVRQIRDGVNPNIACKQTLDWYLKSLPENYDVGDISLIAMNNEGEYGVATNIDEFSIVYADDNKSPRKIRVKK